MGDSAQQTICPKTSGLPGEDGTSSDIYNRLIPAQLGQIYYIANPACLLHGLCSALGFSDTFSAE